MNRKQKNENFLKLDMPFSEALKRFASVGKKEIKEAIDKEKIEKERK